MIQVQMCIFDLSPYGHLESPEVTIIFVLIPKAWRGQKRAHYVIVFVSWNSIFNYHDSAKKIIFLTFILTVSITEFISVLCESSACLMIAVFGVDFRFGLGQRELYWMSCRLTSCRPHCQQLCRRTTSQFWAFDALNILTLITKPSWYPASSYVLQRSALQRLPWYTVPRHRNVMRYSLLSRRSLDGEVPAAPSSGERRACTVEIGARPLVSHD